MTARSVVLSVLLGAHPAWATAAELLRLTADFGIKETALRVALTRMVATGDLIRSEDGYRLSGRLLARQRRQDDALSPPTRRWDGNWVTAVVTAVGADARSRAALRTALADNRLGELREGLWLRPDNLAVSLPTQAARRVRIMHTRDDAPAELAGLVWDLPGWAATARRLLREMSRADGVPARFAIAAAMVRHLLADPVLPAELLPGDWPGDDLRSSYADFAALMTARRDSDSANRMELR
jgi:phenylacetic acid degradation operon negative regulatory protein